MNVLVTGAEGYLGIPVCQALAAAGATVFPVDAGWFDGAWLGDPQPYGKIKRIDIRDLSAGHLEGVDAVCHLAGLSNDPLGALDEQMTYAVNEAATVQLATRSRTAGVRRFVFSSSCSTYGRTGAQIVDERSATAPVTAYGRSKVGAEAELAKLASPTFTPVSLRNATVYGFAPKMRTDIVVNNLCAWALAAGRIQLLGDGQPWRPLIHVRDVAQAFVAAVFEDLEPGAAPVVNVGSNEQNYRVIEIAKAVQDAVPGCEIVLPDTVDPDDRSYQVNFDKIGKVLPSFRCEWDLRRGIREILDAYVDYQFTREQHEHGQYERVRHLQRLIGNGVMGKDFRLRGSGELLAS